MTKEEFSNQFDTLYNNISSNTAPGLNEYEKSVFLTQAQEMIVDYIYGTFEESEQDRRFLNNLVTTSELLELDKHNTISVADNSQLFALDDKETKQKLKVKAIVYEYAKYDSDKIKDSCAKTLYSNKAVDVIPIQLDDLRRILRNPFKGITDNRVLRIDSGIKAESQTIELISKYPISSYVIKYIRRPHPIILTNIEDDGLSIEGEQNTLNPVCELDESLHYKILKQAVELAKAAFIGTQTNSKQ